MVGAITRKDGYIEGNGYIVGWCLGHLAQLVGAEAYDPQLNRWRVADLPILPQDWRYRVPQDKRKQFGILRGLMLRDDVSQVINACDAGREGELMFKYPEKFTAIGGKLVITQDKPRAAPARQEAER